MGLELDPRKPLVAVVSRLVPQKGPHLIRAAIQRTLDAGGQFVLLGSGHRDPEFKQLAAKVGWRGGEGRGGLLTKVCVGGHFLLS